MPTLRRRPLEYGLAIVAAGLALTLTSATTGLLGGAYLYFPLVAVFVSALYGGLGPGLVTVALCVAGFDLLFLGVPLQWSVGVPREVHRLVVFILFGIGVTWVAARFRTAKREAEAASKEARRIGAQQERLVAVVSHDLRNPLAALQGHLGMLGRHGPLTDRQEQAVANMRRTIGRMDAMIRSLLDLAQTRQGGLLALSPTDIRVGEVCARVLAEARAAHPDIDLSLVVEGDDRAHADAERIAQAVSNLVANALQHGAQGAPVRVRVTEGQADVTIEVHSAGEPIPPDLGPSLFDPFRRGRNGQGVGLGLFVVREIARAHGGGAGFRSVAGGSVFEVRLPRRREAVVPPP